MRRQSFIYLEPRSLKEALMLLDEHKEKIKVLSGGTEMVALMKLHLVKPQYVMSLKRLSNLKGIQKKDNKIIIGGTTTLREIIESPSIKSSLNGIIEAALSVAAPQIQNVGTIAGNILQDSRCLFYNQSELVRNGFVDPCFKLQGHSCKAVKGAKHCFSVYQSDLAPILVAFRAKAKLEKKGGSRTVFVAELFSGNGKQPINIEKNELLTKIIIPIPEGRIGSTYQKLRMRGSIDYPLASVASVVKVDNNGRVVDSSVVIGAAGPLPKTVPETFMIKGKTLNAEFIDTIAQAAYQIAEAVNNQPLPGLYRRKMVKALTKRALSSCLKDIYGE